MSWQRPHLDRMAKLQQQIQRLVAEAGTDAIGTDWLVEANECVASAQNFAATQIERREKREEVQREWKQLISAAREQGRT
jgi:hypothetical protein